jgi:superfamily II DNA helicase RecQ
VPALDPGSGEHDVNQFCAQHRVVSIERRLVTVHDRPVWCFCIEYLLHTNTAAATGGGDYRARVDYKQVLNEDDFRVFSKLREMRKGMSEQEQIPVFSVFTNEQLANIARQRPTTAAELQRIDGIGDGKVARYGERVLAVVGPFGRSAKEPAAAEAAAPGSAPA